MTGTILSSVAFIGKAGAGKTTCAELLVKHFGYERLSFAAPLKVMCGTTTDRSLLQNVGVGVRELVEDGWVNLLLHEKDQRITKQQYDGGGINPAPFTVDDCRFYNEAQALQAEGFVIVRVTAPTTRRIDRLKLNGKLQDEAQLDHVSETALDDFPHDYRIVNDGWPDSILGALEQIVNGERS